MLRWSLSGITGTQFRRAELILDDKGRQSLMGCPSAPLRLTPHADSVLSRFVFEIHATVRKFVVLIVLSFELELVQLFCRKEFDGSWTKTVKLEGMLLC